jgi:hypothetical protein
LTLLQSRFSFWTRARVGAPQVKWENAKMTGAQQNWANPDSSGNDNSGVCNPDADPATVKIIPYPDGANASHMRVACLRDTRANLRAKCQPRYIYLSVKPPSLHYRHVSALPPCFSDRLRSITAPIGPTMHYLPGILVITAFIQGREETVPCQGPEAPRII